ncbi:hypothetical protein VJ923_00210 [Adlercreutzia sp. R25]|uniref:PepSY domain-containing protein n=1 Tax=Adlercreutzia shanghongiae TaxID=3111773 RepID=A0ABU6J224_9ACTN|nr:MULTISPECIES: hypothetical protein [unclassified Adlercreutzia]MEC4271582.1 hypothetical protein [Adlercreutzia sp. R25]MEC4295779.1 hypothetical protein [Adlercreutzia sp. R22]
MRIINITRSNHFVLTIVAVLAAFCLTLCGGFAFAGDKEGRMVDRGEFLVNEAGQTYGTAFDAESSEAEPDLIEAVATNGQEGYVLKVDLDKASHADEGVDELLISQEERREMASGLLLEKMNDRDERFDYSIEEAELALAYGLCSESVPSAKMQDALGVSADDSMARVRAIEKDTLVEMIYEVDEAMTVYIPVYEIDGVTRIGEFPVSQL